MAIAKLLSALVCTASSAAVFSGDTTYYDPEGAPWAYGRRHLGSDKVASVPFSHYGNCPNPNDYPSCGKTVRIHCNGKTTTAKVVDECEGCAGDSIDVTKAVFGGLADLDLGCVQVTWEWA
ncbi:hypothetical protein DL766_000424 [Monosporascus sp. MC13-8B]|uniref:RlpA-like protein double-psi beta-barrel domain-containing protein n=1 Tax=Monosporascus cannonballus TaxID=155416 RepID=A0ABY0HEH2_9PEZI|nr:hypothetical protein DL762_003149 [Monosporascus cannonballus]RYO99003.1 hypothetical protein DL763_001808 [Monosporascus cannonballus]RYP39399.1 hypothetical protein DL766_000424 [Monosporascus sp. MC13-8B]